MAHNRYKVVIVTGARRGIGAAIVRRLARRSLSVVATSRSPEGLRELARDTGCRVLGLDVADRAAVAEALGALETDVLVNNAASPGTTEPLHRTSGETVDALLDANVKGPLNMIAAVVPGMIARGRGHIVNIGSASGHAVIPGMPAYAATKAAVSSISRNLRLELHGTGVRVTEIVPGRVRTGIHLDMMEDEEEARQRFYDGYACLEPDDIASAVEFVIEAPARMDVTLIEILPTDQVLGGGLFHRRG